MEREDICNFLLLKFESLAQAYDVRPPREAEFQRLFGLEHEVMVADYSCTFWNRFIHVPGRIYISENCVCYASAVSNHSSSPAASMIIIPFASVRDIVKERSLFGLLSNSIRILTNNEEQVRKTRRAAQKKYVQS
jgi:hypothetical protein